VVFFEVRNGFSVLYVDVIAVVLLLAIIYWGVCACDIENLRGLSLVVVKHTTVQLIRLLL
jgi:hypothetical protein